MLTGEQLQNMYYCMDSEYVEQHVASYAGDIDYLVNVLYL